jgi:hypothetical protein
LHAVLVWKMNRSIKRLCPDGMATFYLDSMSRLDARQSELVKKPIFP